MYQFYYGVKDNDNKTELFKKNINDYIEIHRVRPTMWEEHCLECSAPLCFNNCLNYEARDDGRCKRFTNGMNVFSCQYGNSEQGVNVTFKKWANMMTIIYPGMLDVDELKRLTNKNEKLGNKLKKIVHSHLPISLKWNLIRTIEYLRRRKLRNNHFDKSELYENYFIFHGYSYCSQSFKLIIEIYDAHIVKDKMSFEIEPGENMIIQNNLSKYYFEKNYLVKVYPENNIEAELDILWCDFVQGIDKRKNDSKVKCLVWDLDNTLWDGTLIETDDPDQLQLKPYVLSTIKELDERGILQSIASKNDYDLAWPVIEKLGLKDYFLYPQINWNQKSFSLKEIAKQLNIGIDSLAIIDDSDFERREVSTNSPEVRVYDEKQLCDLLLLNEFNVLVTKESKKRREMYLAEQKRENVKLENNESLIEFIKKCNLKIELFNPTTEEEIARCYELTVRTNQLNLSGNKYSRDEFNSLLKVKDRITYGVRCSDDFGDYGIVGFGQYKVVKQKIVFTEYAMSCRVAGKYIESSLFYNLLKKEKCKYGEFVLHKTKKNDLLRRTLEDIGFKIINNQKEIIQYEFDENLKNKEVVYYDFI